MYSLVEDINTYYFSSYNCLISISDEMKCGVMSLIIKMYIFSGF